MRKVLYIFCGILFGGILSAQTLTISSSGEAGSSGTNWSITGNTLTVSGTANIRASVIENHLTNTGPLTIVGNTTPDNLQVSINEAINVTSGSNNLVIGASVNKGGVTITQTIVLPGSISFHGGWVRLENHVETTGSGAKILVKANEPVLPSNATDGFISLSLGKNLTTNEGDIILWANATNRTAAFGQANNEIVLAGSNVLATSGGKIVLAGGLDDGSNGGTASDGIPDGYAYRGSYGGEAINIMSTVTLNSGGGEIIIRGEQNGFDYAVGFRSNLLINSGMGAITIDGQNSGNHAIDFADGNFAITSASTADTAITISGTTTTAHAGIVASFNSGSGHSLIQTTGASGGGIVLRGINSGTAVQGLWLGNNDAASTLQIISNTGDISLITSGNTAITNYNVYLGNRLNATTIQGVTPEATSAAGNILIQTGGFSFGSTHGLTVSTSGTIVVEPYAISFLSAISWPLSNFSLSGNETGLRLGKSGNTANITIGSATSIAGPISIYGGIVTVNQNLTSTASGADILLQANENIVLAANRTIQTDAGDITFRANAGGTPLPSEHAIRLFSGTSLLSNGGNITLGGNFDGTEGAGLYAATNRVGGRAAIVLENATITAAGGDIKIYGRAVSSYDDGILFYGNFTTTGSGTIGLYGDAFGGNNGSAYFGGITVWSTTKIESEDGNVALKGVLTNTQSNSTGSINFYRAQGTANNHISILSKTGDVLISGDAGTTAAWGINHNSGGNIYVGSPADGSWIATGDIEISYSNLANAAFRGIKVNTTGNVSWVPVGTSFTAAQTLPPTANYELAQNASSLTIGKQGNTANITIGQAQTIAGDFTLHGGALALNAAITATNADINLHASGNVTQNAAGILTANNLGLHGTGNFTLTNTSNNVITIAGGDNITPLGNLSFVDASGGLEIGSVNPTGITSTGNILIETLTGDIQLNQPISTTSNTTTATGYTGAIVLNAGKSAAIGSFTGGDIKVGASGSISAPNGITKLYSGTNFNSTGLTSLVGGAVNTRTAVDETTVNFSPVLSATGGSTYAMYRIAEGTGDLTIVASGGDALNSTWIFDNGAIRTIGSPVNVNASDVVNYLSSGDLTIEAGNITVNADVISATGNDLTLKSKGFISTLDGKTIQSDAGNIIYWADSDGDGSGYINVDGNVTLDTRTAADRTANNISTATGGGQIVLAGGVNSTNGIPTGFAAASTNTNPGIKIGHISDNWNGVTFYSGGGAITINGKSTGGAGTLSNYGGRGVFVSFMNTINAGTGTIAISGEAQSMHGIEIGSSFNNPGFSAANSWNIIQAAGGTANDPAITLNGSTNASNEWGISMGWHSGSSGNEKSLIQATGAGGISLTASNSAGTNGLRANSSAFLSATGAIDIITGTGDLYTNATGRSTGDSFFGSCSTCSFSAVSSSTANVTFTFDNFSLTAGTSRVNTTGQVVVEPFGASFTAAISFPNARLVLDSGISGLRIGKAGNNANLTLTSALTVAGPISAYGNLLTVQQDIAATLQNAPITLVSHGEGSGSNNGFIILNSNVDLTTEGGNIILWSNAANRTSGTANNEIILAGNSILTSKGGKIVLAGGLDDGANGGTAADGIPDGYAYRGGLVNEAVDFRGNVTLDSDGGEIIIRGEQNGSAEGVGSDNTLTISNAGPITILGKNTTNVSVRLGASNISSTVANAPVSILGTTHLRNGGLISITTQGGDVVLASNIDAADNTTNGYINLRSGLSITSNGGDITLGGGNANGTDYAFGSSAEDYTEGVRLDLNANLNSGGGNISIKGKSYNRGVQSLFGAAAVGFYSVANGSINSGTGTILIDGYSQTSVSQYASGILFSNATPFTIQSANTTSDAIILNGFASGASGFAYGIEAKAGTLNVLATAAGGSITLNTGNSIANWYDAVFRGPTNILAVDGPISLKGGQLGGVANGRFYTANTFNLGSKAATDITASSSDLLIEFDRVEFASTKPQIATTGSVTWQPNSASFGATQVTSDFQWNQNSQTMTALTIGKAGNTASITHQTNALSAAGPITIHSGALAINAALTATNDVISLFASGNVTQTAALVADNLSLNGTGNFTLQNNANDVATLAGGAVADLLGNVAYRDANALEIGTVVTQSGIFSSGTVLVETENGNLTLSQDLNTTSTSDDALILNAGRASAAGTLTGGDIIINGSPTLTYGSGGRAKLFSGYESNSTGLTALVGANNTRFGFDENSTISPALADDNAYAIYRLAEGTGDLTIVSSGGDAEGTTWTYSNGIITTINGTVNLLNTDLEAKLANGDVSIEAGKVTFSANVTNSTSNAFKVLSKSHILNTNATTITTQGGDVLLAANVDDATDGESAINGQIRMGFGLNITTNGGDIILGGENNEGSGYAMGQNFNNLPEGIRIDGSVALNSGGGNIIMRGKTPAVGIASDIGGAGIMFYNIATGSIYSGTGTILMDGYSQTSVGNAIAGLLWWNLNFGGTFTIESANTTANAITLNGYATGASGQAWGIETEANNTLNILATASGGGIAINTGFQNTSEPYDIVFRGPTNILAADGPISLKGGQFGGASNGVLFISSDLFLGSKASTAVTSSESDIAIEFDRFAFNLLTPKIATTGAVSVKSANAAFGQAFSTNWFAWNQNSLTISGLTIGKPGNTSDVTHNTPITVAGPVSMYGGRVSVASNLTSSADGDIFLKAISGAAPDVQINSGVTVAKTGGAGTLTLQGHGRVNQHGTVTATAPGVLNVVLWSDFDNDNDDGGTDMSGSITTNGGHVWLGGSNSDGGSYTWNGLTVGDGPSVGDFFNNHNAMDLAGNVTTNGGDFLAWAGNSHAVNGIGTVPGSGNVINTGSGNITLIANQILGQGPLAIKFQTTGVFSLVPNGGAFPSGLNWNPVMSSGNFDFSGDYNYLDIPNVANLGGLVIGRYDGMLDGTDPVVIGNTGNVTLSTATSIAGPISVYGGNIAINENLNTSAGAADGDVLLKATGNNNLANSKSITTAGGDVTFWSDSDGNGTGYAQIGSATAITTGGGNITLGGGTDIATGYARGEASRDTETEPTFNLYVSGVHLKNGASLSSGGGNITLRGQNVGNGDDYIQFGIMGHNATVNAGSGKVSLNGIAKGSSLANSQAISVYGNGWSITSSNPNPDAIILDGDASAYDGANTSLGINFGGTIESTGGGGILINGKSGTATGVGSTDLPIAVGGSILAKEGTIEIKAENNVATQTGLYLSGATLGFKSSSNVTASTSNIILKSDNTVFNSATNLNTNGAVTLLPLDASTSFGVAQTLGSNIVLSADVSGLTIGKSGNTANITISSAKTIAGPIDVYGGTIALNADLTTTNGGAISLYSDNALGLSSARNITADGVFQYIPRTDFFVSDVTFPIANLSVASKGLTIGKSGNDKNITLAADLTTDGPVALFGNEIAMNHHIACDALTLEGTATLASGKTIDADGNFANNDGLILKHGASGYSQLRFTGTYSGTGTVTMEQEITGTGWRNIGIPFSGLQASDLGTVGTNPLSANVKYWNTDTYNWSDVTNPNANLEAGKGYNTFFGSDFGLQTGNGPWILTISGSPHTLAAPALSYNDGTVQNAWQSFANPAQKAGWNLIANPFTAALDFENMTMPQGLNRAFYVWNPNKGGGPGYDNWSPAGINAGLIAPMQSFWVQTTNAMSGAATMPMSMSSHSRVVKTGKPGFLKTQNLDFDRIVLWVKRPRDTIELDHTVVALIEGTTNGYDAEWDAHKWMNPGAAVNLYSTQADARFANNAVSYTLGATQSKAVPIGFACELPGVYQIQFDNNWMLNSYYLMLEDRLTGKYHDLNKGGAYSFENKADFTNRFILHIGNNPINTSRPSAPVDFWYANGTVHLSSIAHDGLVNCYLTDLAGRGIWVQEKVALAPGVEQTLALPTHISQGVYVLTVVADGKAYSNKIIK